MKFRTFLLSCLIFGLLSCGTPAFLMGQNVIKTTWPEGNARYEGSWEQNLRIGKHKWWHENGEKMAEVNFSESGKPLVAYSWNEKGEIMDEITYEYDRNMASQIKPEKWDTLANGLMFCKLTSASVGGFPLTGEKITVRYTGCLADGSVFEDNFKEPKPFRFKFGENEVIKGFEEAISKLKPNEKCIVKIPPELGYGTQLVGSIPPDSELIYLIERLFL